MCDYLVRRGTWFFQEGSVLRPCEENLAAQLEEVPRLTNFSQRYTNIASRAI
jgi:hypothetical protein